MEYANHLSEYAPAPSEAQVAQTVARIRFGIGGEFARGFQVDYVLGHWTAEEEKLLPERLKVFGDAILSFATVGAELTMNAFNKK